MTDLGTWSLQNDRLTLTPGRTRLWENVPTVSHGADSDPSSFITALWKFSNGTSFPLPDHLLTFANGQTGDTLLSSAQGGARFSLGKPSEIGLHGFTFSWSVRLSEPDGNFHLISLHGKENPFISFGKEGSFTATLEANGEGLHFEQDRLGRPELYADFFPLRGREDLLYWLKKCAGEL